MWVLEKGSEIGSGREVQWNGMIWNHLNSMSRRTFLFNSFLRHTLHRAEGSLGLMENLTGCSANEKENAELIERLSQAIKYVKTFSASRKVLKLLSLICSGLWESLFFTHYFKSKYSQLEIRKLNSLSWLKYCYQQSETWNLFHLLGQIFKLLKQLSALEHESPIFVTSSWVKLRQIFAPLKKFYVKRHFTKKIRQYTPTCLQSIKYCHLATET